MMKRQTIKFVSAALLGVAVFASCQDYTPDEQAIAKRKTVADYEKAFNAEFPIIDPEQNWGFYPMPICGEDVDITRGTNAESNQWESKYHYVVPGGPSPNNNAPWGWAAGDVSNYERAYVYWWFSTHPWVQPILVNWSEFFVENIWGQPEHTTHLGDASDYIGSVHAGMDNLHVLRIDQDPIYSLAEYPITIVDNAMTNHSQPENDTEYEHVLNFNSAGATKEQVEYVYDISTRDFLYEDTRGTGDKFHNNWTIQYINGNYYLGFDFWCEKKNEKGEYIKDNYSLIKPDGYYNDWIIKLSSGKHIVDSYTRRIMCEDLGNTFDWDFNDLVFDVTIYNGNYGNGNSGYYAQITLQAAGGTLPIYIGQKDQAHEAHFLFGVESNVPVNVDAAGGVNRPAVVFHLPLDNSYQISTSNINGKPVLSFDPNQIPIYVTRADMPDPANAVKLTTEKGKAPQKFACPCDTYWMKEFKNIEGVENKQIAGHPYFAQWVAAGSSMQNDDDAFITERSKDDYPSAHFQVLYADANGSPFSVSFSEDGNVGTIQPWKDLWNSTFNDPLNSQFTEVRSYPNYVNKDGTDMTDESSFTTYSTTFQAQAPFIYVNKNNSDDPDPIAYSASLMQNILNGYVDQEVSWSPEAKIVTLESENGVQGYVLGSGYYHKGANVLIQAVPRKYYAVDRWEDMDENTISTDANYTIPEISENKHYKAFFKRKSCNVTAVVEPAGAGYVLDFDDSDDWNPVEAGIHSFYAYANEGYIFDHWDNDPNDNDYEKEVDVDGDVTITAHFRVAQTYMVTVQANDASFGNVCLDYANSGKVTGQYNEGVAFVRAIATPNLGYRFVKWTDEDGSFLYYNAQFDFEHLSEYANNNKEINLIAHFESNISYEQGSEVAPNAGYPDFLASLTGPLTDNLNLRDAVNGLNNYGQCCIEITYVGSYVGITADNGHNGFEYVSQITTRSAVLSCANQLVITQGASYISKLTIWVKKP